MSTHAFGQRYELPIPLILFVVGGAVVVLASFLLVMSRLVAADHVRTDPREDAPAAPRLGAAGGLSVLWLVLLVAFGWAGSQDVGDNLLPTFFWLVVWIALPLSCGLFGDWTAAVNPFAVLARACDRPAFRRAVLGTDLPVRWPAWTGWWVAVGWYFVLACGELIVNVTATVPRNIALALACYAVVSACAGLLFGPSWLQFGEVFSVLFATWGRLGYFRFRAVGRRGFAGGLDAGFGWSTSRIVFVLLLLVSVNFDGLLATPGWSNLERHVVGLTAADDPRLASLRLTAFVALSLAISLVFVAFAAAASRVGRHGHKPRAALAVLLPSLLPIAFGYLLAHNVQYLVVNGQLLFTLVGNPVGLASWPVHLPYPFDGTFEPNVALLPTGLSWYVAVLVIVAAHVIAVVLAHRQLGSGQPGRAQGARASELPWLAAMVGYTMLSLWLIAQPLVQDGATSVSALAAAVGSSWTP